jgi:hypothetical protein
VCNSSPAAAGDFNQGLRSAWYTFEDAGYQDVLKRTTYTNLLATHHHDTIYVQEVGAFMAYTNPEYGLMNPSICWTWGDQCCG